MITKQQQAEKGKKGGVSKLRNASVSLAKRKRCNTECPVYPCIHAPLARTDVNGKKLAKGKAKCIVNGMDPKVRLRLARLLLNGESGMVQEIERMLVHAAEGIDKSDITDVERYVNLLLKTKTAIYGNDQTINKQYVQVVNFQWAKGTDDMKQVTVEVENDE